MDDELLRESRQFDADNVGTIATSEPQEKAEDTGGDAPALRVPVDVTPDEVATDTAATLARLAALERHVNILQLTLKQLAEPLGKAILSVAKDADVRMAKIEADFASLIARLESRLAKLETGTDAAALKAELAKGLEERARQIVRHSEHLGRLQTAVTALQAKVDR